MKGGFTLRKGMKLVHVSEGHFKLYQSIRIKQMLGQVNNEGLLDPKERHEIGTRVRRPLFMRCLYRASIK